MATIHCSPTNPPPSTDKVIEDAHSYTLISNRETVWVSGFQPGSILESHKQHWITQGKQVKKTRAWSYPQNFWIVWSWWTWELAFFFFSLSIPSTSKCAALVHRMFLKHLSLWVAMQDHIHMSSICCGHTYRLAWKSLSTFSRWKKSSRVMLAADALLQAEPHPRRPRFCRLCFTLVLRLGVG